MHNLLIILLIFFSIKIVAQTTVVETNSKNTKTNIEILEDLANQFGSESEAFLDYWQIHYPLMSDTAAIEKIWQFLIETRIKEFGENSNSHISALFGLSSFYKRCDKVAEYQALRKQVEVYWKEAYEAQIVKETEEKDDEVPEETCCGCMPELPRFPGCEAREGDSKIKKSCSDQKLLKFIYNVLQNPKLPVDSQIEILVVISFIVSEYGTITDTKILRDTGGGHGKEAARVINFMNELPIRWRPGYEYYDKKPTHVKYNLPIRFKLN